MTGSVGAVLAVALLAFVGVASCVLLWDGLAARTADRGGAARLPARSRAEVAVGAIGFAVVLWIALGLLKHAS
jgi:hypothetical protein